MKMSLYQKLALSLFSVFILIVGAFITILALGLKHLQKPNALENVEKRLDEAQEKQSVLTENEKNLKQESQTKEWEEVDKETDK